MTSSASSSHSQLIPEAAHDPLYQHYVIERELADRLRRASQAQRRTLYAQVYDERAARIVDHPLVTRALDPVAQARDAERQLRLLRPFLSRDCTFLEIGPGDCALARSVAGLVKHVIAIDVSFALPQARGLPINVQTLLFDGITLPDLMGGVDVIYSRDVIEHLHPEDALDQLRAAHAALRRGGRYICVTPNRLTGPWDVSRHFSSTPQGFHLREYTAGELADLFLEAGFSKVSLFLSYHGVHLTPLFPSRWIHDVEAWMERQSIHTRRSVSEILAAIKVVAEA